MIKIYDRIKEITYTIGTGNIALSGVVRGFSSFSSVYSNNDELFYAITDGTNYEIGSGIYLSTNHIKRFPVKSTNSNNLVNFTEGLKEIYVNYPATNAVFNTSGLSPIPQNSGLAFWTSSNALSYSNKITVDSGNGRIGINKSNPTASIDIGGQSVSSNIRASGFIVGNFGVSFPSGNNGSSSYTGGTQLTHFEMNQIDAYLGSVIQLSGIINQNFSLKKQNAGMVFAGPPSGCSPPCNPQYPNFRPLTIEDIPDLSSLYLKSVETTNASVNDGRLSLSSTNPVVDGSGRYLYFTPYKGGSINLPYIQNNQILWSNIKFSQGASGSGVLVADSYNLPQSPYTPQLDNIYDVFGYLQSGKLQFYVHRWFGHEIDLYEEEGESYYPNTGNSYRYFPISLVNGVYCSPSGGTSYTFARYLGTVKTSKINNQNMFFDTPQKRLIYNSDNKVTKNMSSKTASANLIWTDSLNNWDKIPYFGMVEVVNGLTDSTLDLSLVLKCSLPGSYSSSYVCGIVPEDETADYDSDCTDKLNSGFNYGDLASGLMYSDSFAGEYSVVAEKTLVSRIMYAPSGYTKFFPIEKVLFGYPTRSIDKSEGEYGIMGTYQC